MTTTERDLLDEWLVALASLTAGTTPLDAAREKLRTYHPVLRTEFNPDTFSAPSLAAVARQCKFLPSYAEVATALSAWRREHQPPPSNALPPPPGTGLPPDPERWITFWQTRRRENFKPYPNGAGSPRGLLDLIRCRSVNVYNWLIVHDDKAAEVARVCGWHREHMPTDPLPTQADHDAAHAAVGRATAAIRAGPLYQPSQPSPDEPPPRPTPRHLTPEQLDQLNPLPEGQKRSR